MYTSRLIILIITQFLQLFLVLFFYYSTCSLFAIFPVNVFSIFFFPSTPISLCLSGNLLYFYIYIYLVNVATIYFPVLFFLWFPILWLQSLSTSSHSCCLLCTSLCYRYFIRWGYPSYIHINQCYILQHVIFVFLLCLNSHLSFLSFFCGHFLISSCMGYR